MNSHFQRCVRPRAVLSTLLKCSTLASCLFVLAPRSSYAQVLYDNLGLSGRSLFPDPGDSLLAQQFVTGDFDTVASITLPLRKEGSPSGLLEFAIWDADAAGLPQNALAALGSIDAATLSTDSELVTIEGHVTGLEQNTPYFIVVDVSDATFQSQQINFTTVEPDAGTNGAATALVTIPDWTPLHSLLGPQSNYLQMAVTAVPEPSSVLLSTFALLGAMHFTIWKLRRNTQ